MHPFWSSHEEKCAYVRLSMGGQPWPSSRSINGGMANSRERKGREGEGARMGVQLGEREGYRRCAMGARPCCSFGSVRAVVGEEGDRKEEEEKRREEREKKGRREGKKEK
jgi:hypothetical protein